MKLYMCVLCGFVFQEEKGCSEVGIEPATLWRDVPNSWKCPDCGSDKENFDRIDIGTNND